MLPPEYLWSVADSVINTYDEMNNWAIKDMVERLLSAELYGYDGIPGTARYRAWMLNQAGMHYQDMVQELARVTGKAEDELKKMFIEAGLMAAQTDYADAGQIPEDKQVYDITQDKKATQILQAAYEQTKGELHNYTGTTLDQSNKALIDMLDKAYYEITSGYRTYSEVIKEVIENAAADGCTVVYPSGHVDSLEVAVRRAVLTGVNRAAANITLHDCEELGTDYVIVTNHVGARYSESNPIANHLGWQGKVYKIHGTGMIKYQDRIKAVKNLEQSTGYPGDPLGLCGYNCRHNMHVFFEGDNPDKYAFVVPDEEESKRQYDLSQRQRKMERNIRKSKRLLQGYQVAIDNCRSEQARFDLQMEYDKISFRLQKQNKAYNMFCEENDLQKEQERIQIAKWNRQQAYDATRGANRYKAYFAKEKVVHNDSSQYDVHCMEVVKKYEAMDSNIKWESEINGVSRQCARELNSIHTDLNYHMHSNLTEKTTIVSMSGMFESVSDIGTKINETKLGRTLLKKLKTAPDNDIIFSHVHPTNNPFGEADIDKLVRYKSIKALTVECMDGRKYILERGRFESSKINIFRFNMELSDIVAAVREKYNFDIEDNSQQYLIFEEYLKELNKAIAEKYGMIFKEIYNDK